MNNSTIALLIDGAAGIYVPKNFYETFDFKAWNLDISDFADLSDPDNEGYWDAWEAVLRNAVYHNSDGHVWRLYHDGDLFAVRDDHEVDE